MSASLDVNATLARRFTHAHDHSTGTPDEELFALFAEDAAGSANFSDDAILLPELRALRVLERKAMKDYRLATQKVHVTQDGFVWEYVSESVVGGKPARVSVCMVVTVFDGKVQHMRSYMDPAQLAPLMSVLQGASFAERDF